MNIINRVVCTFLLLTTSCTLTWDYDWDIIKPGGGGTTFKQLSINGGNKTLSGGVHSILANGNTYQIAYSDNYLFFNNNGSQYKFNQTALGSNTIAPPITAMISTGYAEDLTLRILFVNFGGIIYSCKGFDGDNVSCVTPAVFSGIPNQPTMVTGNNGYAYAVSTATNPPAIYLAQGKGIYNIINNPTDDYRLNISQLSSITTDINGNFYALVTYGSDNSAKYTYLDRYSPSANSWSKIVTSANLLAINTPMAVNSAGIVFFLNPTNADNISCNNGEEKISVGYIKNGIINKESVVIDNNCMTAIGVNQISIDNTDNIYISLSNNTVFYGTIKT
jgi:hypothetical protein